jgi:hypothetical protein
MTHQDLVGAEGVPIGAAGQWLCHPLPAGRPNKLILHA